MVDAILQEANTRLAREINAEFFFDLPTDQRYVSYEFHKMNPTNALSEHSDIKFRFPAFTGPSYYILKDIYCDVSVSLLTKDGDKIPEGKDVSVVNNTGHSLFNKVDLKLENESINRQCDSYHYKAYIKNLLSYSTMTKTTTIGLGSDNFYHDTPNMFDKMDDSQAGYQARRRAFAEVKTSGTALNPVKQIIYYGDDVRYVFKLHHDLTTCDLPLINGVNVYIDLGMNKQSFVCKTKETGDVGYQLKIKEIFLYVPVAVVASSLNDSICRTLESKPIIMHYTKATISTHEIPLNSLTYTSDLLSFKVQMPSKIIIGFVLTEAVNGSYQKNGFKFGRRWDGSNEPALFQEQREDIDQTRNDDFEILDMQRRVETLRNELTHQNVRQRRNSLTASLQRFLGLNRQSQSADLIDGALLQRLSDLEDSIENIRLRLQQQQQQQQHRESAQSNHLSDTEPGNFIEAAWLNLNGKPLDQFVQYKATAREDPINYARFNHFLNFNDSLFSNSVSYQDFLGGNFFLVFDMTTCSKSNLSFMVPSIRLGTLELNIKFHKTLTKQLTMVVYSEHPSVLTINKERKISLSYSRVA